MNYLGKCNKERNCNGSYVQFNSQYSTVVLLYLHCRLKRWSSITSKVSTEVGTYKRKILPANHKENFQTGRYLPSHRKLIQKKSVGCR